MAELCGKPLTFGDVDQIREINKQQKEDEARLEYEKGKEAGTLKRFKVRYEVIEPHDDEEIIEALDTDHAEKLFWQLNKNRHSEIEIMSVKEV